MNVSLSRFLEIDNGMLPAKAIITDDPMRVKMLAAHYLENAVIVSEKRGMIAYSGNIDGTPLCLLSSGYGESALLNWLYDAYGYGVREVIYIGECISRLSELKLRSIVVPHKAIGKSSNEQPSSILLEKAKNTAARINLRAYTAETYTDDRYWTKEDSVFKGKNIIDCTACGLFRFAREKGINALVILTVSEHAVTGERVDEAERQSRFFDASRLTFEILKEGGH